MDVTEAEEKARMTTTKHADEIEAIKSKEIVGGYINGIWYCYVWSLDRYRRARDLRSPAHISDVG